MGPVVQSGPPFHPAHSNMAAGATQGPQQEPHPPPPALPHLARPRHHQELVPTGAPAHRQHWVALLGLQLPAHERRA